MNPANDRNDIVTEYARTLIRVKAKQLARRPGFCRSDEEDVEQDLVLHLLSQAQHFDPKRGALNTFIARVVNSGVAMLVRDRTRIKRRPDDDVEVQSLEDKVEQPHGPPAPLWMVISLEDLERRIGSKSLTDAEVFELADQIASVMASLPEELRDICESLQHRNRSETECELGLSRRKFNQAMTRIREHFSKSGLGKS